MAIVRHGRVNIFWCDTCSVPLIRGSICPGCGSEAARIEHTPPGDMRPAFPHDVEEVRRMADAQWGEGAGEALVPSEGPHLINPAPSPDRMDEIIVGGRPVASAAFRLEDLKDVLILKKEGGSRLRRAGFLPSRGFVVSDRSALPFLLEGASLLSPGIVSASDGIRPGDEIIVTTEEDGIVGAGLSRKGTQEMVGTKGMGVKVRWCSLEDSAPEIPQASWKEAWDRAVAMNEDTISSLEASAVDFIKEVDEGHGLPTAVSFSGGKDSLVTLLLVHAAGIRSPVLFVDTGIEFPETVRYVGELARTLDLDLHTATPTSSFFEDALRFGPPGRDFRWCCKTCKLGPMTRLISGMFPEGVLTFIGQRRYESDVRERKGAIWKNPWVPGQVGASPIQDWTALDVWLYIFRSSVPYNPLYGKGFARIGCYLCPSTDLHERDMMEGTELDISDWRSFLEGHRVQSGYPVEWSKYGFHRFKRLPPYMVDLKQALGVEFGRGGIENASVSLVDGHNACDSGSSREGTLSAHVPWDAFEELLDILGKTVRINDGSGVDVFPDGWEWRKSALEAFRDGALIVRGRDEPELRRMSKDVVSIAMRALGCVGCGVCVGRCPHGALSIDGGGRVRLDSAKCRHCGSCLGPCPAESFAMQDPHMP